MAIAAPESWNLYDRGWRQGSIFTAPSLDLQFIPQKLDGQTGKAVPAPRRVKNSERLVIVSQDCDIKGSDEANVEAFICEVTRGNSFWGNIRTSFSSRRFFALRDGLLVKATYRLMIEKSLLREIQPEAWPDTAAWRERFVRWLGYRYTQPPIPDDLVSAFQNPVVAALSDLYGSQPDIGKALSTFVGELRLALPGDELPPYSLTPIIMVDDITPTPAQLDALDRFIAILMTSPDPTVVTMRDPDVRLDSEISLQEWRRTSPIYFERYTYAGEEVTGMVPFREM